MIRLNDFDEQIKVQGRWFHGSHPGPESARNLFDDRYQLTFVLIDAAVLIMYLITITGKILTRVFFFSIQRMQKEGEMGVLDSHGCI